MTQAVAACYSQYTLLIHHCLLFTRNEGYKREGLGVWRTVLGQSTLLKAYPDDSPSGEIPPRTKTPRTQSPSGQPTLRTTHCPLPAPPPPTTNCETPRLGSTSCTPERCAPSWPRWAVSPPPRDQSSEATTCRGTRTCRTARRELPGFHSRQSCPTQTFPCPRRSLPGVRVAVASDTHDRGLESSAAAATVPDRAGSGASSCPAGAPDISDSSSSRQSPAGCGLSPPRRLGR